jgi:hypothetical protein
MLGKKRGRFGTRERMHTPRYTNSIEEREKALMPRRGKGVLTKGREKEFQH